MKAEMADSDNDSIWLTQESKVEYGVPNFDVGMEYIEEDIVCSNGVSLEDGPGTSGVHVLYDNVVVEDISSDECVDSM